MADPALGARYVAARIGISERQLSRVFAAQETAVPQYILGLRLERAHRLISSREGGTLSVAEVAHRTPPAGPQRLVDEWVTVAAAAWRMRGSAVSSSFRLLPPDALAVAAGCDDGGRYRPPHGR